MDTNERTLLTRAEFRAQLDRSIMAVGGAARWVAYHRITIDPGYLSRIRNGKAPVPDKIAQCLGYKVVERGAFFEPINAKT